MSAQRVQISFPEKGSREYFEKRYGRHLWWYARRAIERLEEKMETLINSGFAEKQDQYPRTRYLSQALGQCRSALDDGALAAVSTWASNNGMNIRFKWVYVCTVREGNRYNLIGTFVSRSSGINLKKVSEEAAASHAARTMGPGTKRRIAAEWANTKEV